MAFTFLILSVNTLPSLARLAPFGCSLLVSAVPSILRIRKPLIFNIATNGKAAHSYRVGDSGDTPEYKKRRHCASGLTTMQQRSTQEDLEYVEAILGIFFSHLGQRSRDSVSLAHTRFFTRFAFLCSFVFLCLTNGTGLPVMSSIIMFRSRHDILCTLFYPVIRSNSSASPFCIE
jgi:hypothetical protein